MYIVYALACIILLSIFYGKRLTIPSLLIKVAFGFLIFIVIFTFLGLLSGKVSNDSIVDSIYLYAGSPIIALNQYLGSPTHNNIFGYESFTGVRELLNRFFPSINPGLYFLPSIRIGNNVYTNIYTSFRSFIADFGYVGLLSIQFLIGLVYTIFTRYFLNKNSITNLFFPIAPLVVYYVIYQLFTATITYSILSISQIFIFLFLLMFQMFYKKTDLLRESKL
jgi:oligosaccharide repeat unit polymerase